MFWAADGEASVMELRRNDAHNIWKADMRREILQLTRMSSGEIER
jgi:hypothetical protein